MSVLKDSVARALNEQANSELASSNIYLAISFWFAARSFTGSAHWMKVCLTSPPPNCSQKLRADCCYIGNIIRIYVKILCCILS